MASSSYHQTKSSNGIIVFIINNNGGPTAIPILHAQHSRVSILKNIRIYLVVSLLLLCPPIPSIDNMYDTLVALFVGITEIISFR